MLDKRISVEDLRTFWKGCVAIHKDHPVLVINIGQKNNGSFTAQIKNLKDGSISRIDLNEDRDLIPPDTRLGFVNLNGLVVYTSRIPVRRYMMGINDSNLRDTKLVDYFRYERGEIHELSTSSMEFYRTLMGEYPSLEEALDQVKTFGGACAFDRQFAVCENKHIYYKNRRVGSVARGAIDERGIKFVAGKEYLKSVIRNFNYDEAVRNLG